jgi:hypothetical protein
VTTLVCVLVLMAACGSEQKSAEPGTFESLLRFVPDSPQYSGLVRIIDYKALRDSLGVEAPGSDADDDEVLKFKQTLVFGDTQAPVRRPIIFGGVDWLSGFLRGYIQVTNSTRPYLGFDSRDVDQVVYTGNGVDQSLVGFEVVVGGIRAGVAEGLLALCEECVPHEVASYAGKEFFTWGKDASISNDDRLAAPAHDQFGRGGRILVEDGFAIRALYKGAMKDAIDVVSGDSTTGIDDENYVLAVRAMDEAGVISMTVTSQSFRENDVIEAFGDRGRLTFDVERLFNLTTPPPAYEIVSTGIGSDEDGLFGVIALVFKDRKTAKLGADALKDRLDNGALPVPSLTGEEDELRPWSDSVASFSVEVSGKTAVVRLRPMSPEEIQRFVLQGNASQGIRTGSKALFLVMHE